MLNLKGIMIMSLDKKRYNLNNNKYTLYEKNAADVYSNAHLTL